MTKRAVAVVAVLAVGIVVSRWPVTVDVGATQWSAPRTPWGDPDLQGTWSNITATPFERPEDLAGKAVLTAEEAAAYKQKISDERLASEKISNVGYSLEVWFERGDRLVSSRTSAIVDPPDGRVPSLTAEAERKEEMGRAAREAHPADSWEDVSLFTRCLTRGMPASMIPGFYNHNYQILQTPGYVVILLEMIHDVRVIPLDGRPHVAPEIGQWMGDARGRWEGETLVVETTNFAPQSDFTGGVYANLGANYRGSGATLRLTERFTRVDDGTIDYEFTANDPTIWTAPWTASIPMRQDGPPEPLYEYACHEGNYGIVGILTGHRAEEQRSAQL